MTNAKYEDRIAEKTNSIRQLELRRDTLHSEMTLLNKQANTRAKFDLQRNELKSKETELQNM